MTFSVNVPSVDIAVETDYCGIESGSKVDKVEVCGFKTFYGNLETAPMVEQCPVNLECRVMHLLDVGSHILVVGEIMETYISEEFMTDGRPDVAKIKPFAFNPGPGGDYQAFGEPVGEAFSIGLGLRR
jgi:flavin reductase (DIM6/NTAB) family NADH-FMN oxidoreductase RutF